MTAGDDSLRVMNIVHMDQLASSLRTRTGVTITPLASLQDVFVSENRCQSLTAAFRRQQQAPSISELIRLGFEPHFARLVPAELPRMVSPATGNGHSTSGEWSVTTVETTVPNGAVMSFHALVQYALDQGVMQLGAVGSPLNPFLVYDTGRAHFFVCLEGDGDPMDIARHTLPADSVPSDACALVIDTPITLTDGKKTDAIIVMASGRGMPEGETWAQAYRPKGLFQSFEALPFRQNVATSLSLFDAADANV